MNECDHVYVRTGEQHRINLGNSYSKCWDAYYCQKCLKQQYVLVKSSSGYTRTTTYHDGSEKADRLET